MQLTKINVTRIELLNKGREPIEQTCYDRIMNVVQWIDVTYEDDDENNLYLGKYYYVGEEHTWRCSIGFHIDYNDIAVTVKEERYHNKENKLLDTIEFELLLNNEVDKEEWYWLLRRFHQSRIDPDWVSSLPDNERDFYYILYRNQKEEFVYSNQVLSTVYTSPVFTIKSVYSDKDNHMDIDGYLTIIYHKDMYDLLLTGKFTINGKEEHNQTNIIVRKYDEKWINYLKSFPNIDRYTNLKIEK